MNKRYIISSFFNKYDFDVADVLQIIIEHQIDYTTNSNGIFVNLSVIEDTIINKIYDKLISLIKDDPSTKIDIEMPTKQVSQPKPKIKVKETIPMTQCDKLLISLSKHLLTI